MKRNLIKQPLMTLVACALFLVQAHSLQAQESTKTTSEAKDATKIQAELQLLEDQIAKFRSMLESTKGQRSQLEKNLERNEKGINEILLKIEQIQSDLKTGKDEVSLLIQEQDRLNSDKLSQQKYIARQIRASYELGKQEYLKVVLNQENPSELSRMLSYYDYFNRARVEQILSYETTLAELRKIETRIAIQNKQLAKQGEQLQRQQSGLIRAQSDKKKLLRSLNKEIASTGDVIEKRIQDREQLESLLERITAGTLTLSAPEDSPPFKTMKGELYLPVAGKITHRFGARRNDSKLRWDGLFIEADEGEPVKSIHYGRVVFSDWLRGFGLLLIISHGEGYMSLYGHNQVLYRETGDWVSAGELIANVGNSGGQENAGLYFEIRNAGKPSNPQLWCQARAQAKNAA